MEMNKEKLQRELYDRQKALEEEQILNDKLRYMRTELEGQQDQLKEVERSRRKLHLEQEILDKKNQIEFTQK